jgi:hypothetical protein
LKVLASRGFWQSESLVPLTPAQTTLRVGWVEVGALPAIPGGDHGNPAGNYGRDSRWMANSTDHVAAGRKPPINIPTTGTAGCGKEVKKTVTFKEGGAT